MVGNDDYKSALGFNALFFYGRALTVHERTLMIAILLMTVSNEGTKPDE
jgi:hypothetical protein